MKRIAFLIMSKPPADDGLADDVPQAEPVIEYAGWRERDRDKTLEDLQSRERTDVYAQDVVIDDDKDVEAAKSKLDKLERLLVETDFPTEGADQWAED